MNDDAPEVYQCYYCGESVAAPPGRLDECAGCGRYLHVCRMCSWYDPAETSKQCREDDAEEVRDKQAANFCDYFRLAADAFDPGQKRANDAAGSALAALFGDETADQTDHPTDESRLIEDAEALFRK